MLLLKNVRSRFTDDRIISGPVVDDVGIHLHDIGRRSSRGRQSGDEILQRFFSAGRLYRLNCLFVERYLACDEYQTPVINRDHMRVAARPMYIGWIEELCCH